MKKYLSFTAPVAYQNTFPYRAEIYKHAEQINYRIDEYSIRLNGEDVFKKYTTKFNTSKGDDEIFGVEFKDFYDENGNLIMWLWFGMSRFKAIISKENEMRGVRLRKENIQIGNEDALQKLFKEDRGQHYYIGELFAVSKDLIPNSQRDYFNENPMRVWFETELRRYFREALTKVYYDASTANNSYKKIDDYNKRAVEHQQKTNNHEYVDEAHMSNAEQGLKQAAKDAKKAQDTIEKMKQSSPTEAGLLINRVIERIEKVRAKETDIGVKGKTKTIIIEPPVSKPKSKMPLRTDKLSRCNKQERKLISKIFSIILNSTDEDTAEKIIKNIEEEFK